MVTGATPTARTTTPTATWYAGLDLGQSNDFSALALAERSTPATLTSSSNSSSTYAVRSLRRWPLGTGYPAIVRDVVNLLQKLPLARNTTLAVDATGVGPPVVDLLREQAPYWLPIYAVTITAGSAVNRDGWSISVPKRDLVSGVRVMLQARPTRLRAAPTLADAKLLAKELENFQVKINAGGRDTYGAWREGTHDDLVLAVALACWAGEHLGEQVTTPLLEIDWRLGARDHDHEVTSREWLQRRLVAQRKEAERYSQVVDGGLVAQPLPRST